MVTIASCGSTPSDVVGMIITMNTTINIKISISTAAIDVDILPDGKGLWDFSG